MKTRALGWWALLAAVVLAMALGYLMRAPRNGAPPTANNEARAEETRDYAAEFAAQGPVPQPPERWPEASPQRREIEAMLLRMQQGTVPAGMIAAWKAALLASDPQATIAAIREFLATQRDVRTGLGFEMATGGGVLAQEPTLRLLLLDVLGQQARKVRSPEAAAISRGILEEKSSADEWALALRNVAWAEPQSAAYLSGKVRELLRHEPWRAAPSDGLLEALDVAVWTRDATLVPELVAARPANRELAHAVDIALDKLAEAAPAQVMTYLNQNPATLAERPLLRADYFAKADLAQGAQRAQVEIYLGRPDVSPEEKTKLLSALVTPAGFVSDALLTQPPPPDDGTARRAALTQTLAEWLQSNRFPGLRAEIEAVQGRVRR